MNAAIYEQARADKDFELADNIRKAAAFMGLRPEIGIAGISWLSTGVHEFMGTNKMLNK